MAGRPAVALQSAFASLSRCVDHAEAVELAVPGEEGRFGKRAPLAGLSGLVTYALAPPS